MRKLLSALVQLGDALRLELPVPPVHVEHRELLGDSSPALLHHLGGAGELAPVDRHGRMRPDRGASVLVTEDQERQGHELRGRPRSQILGDLVGGLAADRAVRLADAAARHDHDLALPGAHSFFASSSAWPFISSKYACGSSKVSRSFGQSRASMTASHPSPYGSWLMTSGDSSIAGFTSATVPPMGEGTLTLALIVSIAATSSPAATAVPSDSDFREGDVAAALLQEVRQPDADPVTFRQGPDAFGAVEAIGRHPEDELVDGGFQVALASSYRVWK